MGTKGLLLSVVAVSLFAFQKTYEHLGGNLSPDSRTLSQLETEAILNGADPTEILAPTAAGGNVLNAANEACRFGTVVGNDKAEKLDNKYYVSLTKNGVTYIQVSPLIPTYLRQNQTQTVSAQAITPDEEMVQQLGDLFTQRDTCVTADLYIQNIK